MSNLFPTDKPKFPFPTHNIPEIVAWQPPVITPIISNGILLPRTRLVLYGRYKAWKSMVAMNMAYAIATGKPWLGYTTTMGSVLVFQFEIPHALLRNRIVKYSQHSSLYPPNLTFTTPHFLKLDRDVSLPLMKLYLDYYRPQVVVIDPIYKALTGDISSSFDVSKFIDNLDILMERHDFALILVHHERKEHYSPTGEVLSHGSQDMMGSSYIPNWLDTAIQLDRLDDTNVHLSFTAMRHATEELMDLNLRFSHDTLGATIVLDRAKPHLITDEDQPYVEER